MQHRRTSAHAVPSVSGPPSLELFRRARAGDSQALNRLFARYLPQLRRFAQHRVPGWARNGVDTGDLVQETFLRTIRHLRVLEPRGDGALFRYLRRALLNRIRNQFRFGSRHPAPVEIDDTYVDSRPSPLDIAIDRDDRQRYAAALQQMRSLDRDAIVGRIELGYSYEQLALVLNKPTAEAARLAVRRALLRLGELMRRGT
jgi:RNA polymerase sigma factor (sigma-70 family)